MSIINSAQNLIKIILTCLHSIDSMYCVKDVLLSQASIHVLFSKDYFNKEIHLLCLLPKKDKLRKEFRKLNHAEKSKIIAQNNRTL